MSKTRDKMNVALFDSDVQEAADYMKGLEEATGTPWKLHIVTANKGRNCWYNIIRYIKYFWCPFLIFLKRDRYNIIIGWQAFYGIIFAFYCRLFKVKKVNKVVIQHFIYRPKKGFVGKIYQKFITYAITSKYIDSIISCAQDYCKVISETFHIDQTKVIYVPFGVNDFSTWIEENIPEEDFILSVGRSNRDWNFLLDNLVDCKNKIKIISDVLHVKSAAPNIEILNDVSGLETFRYMKRCKCAIIPIQDGTLSSGETVLLQQMCFGKPIIITAPSTLAHDYVVDGYNGLVINKTKSDLISAVDKVYNDSSLYTQLSEHCRQDFVNKYSLYSHGMGVGKAIKYELGTT